MDSSHDLPSASFWQRFVLFSSFYTLTALPHNPKTRPHWNEIIPGLILGGVPIETSIWGHGDHGNKLINQCDQTPRPLGLVVSAMEDWELEGQGLVFLKPVPKHFWQSKRIGHKHVHMADFTGDADLKIILEAVDAIHSARRAGKTAYIHCKAGRGRSFLITMCYLMRHEGMSANEALRTIYQARQQVSPSKAQFDTIEAFRQAHCSGSAPLNADSDDFAPFQKTPYAFFTDSRVVAGISSAALWALRGWGIGMAVLEGIILKFTLDYIKNTRQDLEKNEYINLKNEINLKGNKDLSTDAIDAFNVGVEASKSMGGWAHSLYNLKTYKHYDKFYAGVKAGKEHNEQLQRDVNKPLCP